LKVQEDNHVQRMQEKDDEASMALVQHQEQESKHVQEKENEYSTKLNECNQQLETQRRRTLDTHLTHA
jgi:hypothetical protein